jgi:hypothetical protein
VNANRIYNLTLREFVEFLFHLLVSSKMRLCSKQYLSCLGILNGHEVSSSPDGALAYGHDYDYILKRLHYTVGDALRYLIRIMT